MRSLIKAAGILFLISVTLSGCKNSPTTPSYSFISGPEGSKITAEYPDGSTEEIGSNNVIGWLGGQLLEGNYFKQLRIATEKGTLDFRLSIPEDTGFSDIVEAEHELRETRLLLEDTQSLDGVSAELFFGFSDEFDGLENMSGTVTIEQDISADGEQYDIAGELNGTIVNENGQSVKLSGSFWSKDIDN